MGATAFSIGATNVNKFHSDMRITEVGQQPFGGVQSGMIGRST